MPTFIDKEDLDRSPEVIINNRLVLECPVIGIPLPEVKWFKNGKPLDLLRNPHIKILRVKGGRPLKIMSAKVNDTAIYECRAENEAGTDKISYNVNVHGKRQGSYLLLNLRQYTPITNCTISNWKDAGHVCQSPARNP